MMTCKDVMTKSVVTAEAQDAVINVARQMDTANVGSIPIVLDRDAQELVGILSDRDIVIRVVAPNLSPNTTLVVDVMTPLVFSCHPDDSLDTAMTKMAAHQVRRIPIVDDNKRIVGIIAQADIARNADRLTIGTVVEEISEETTKHKLAP